MIQATEERTLLAYVTHQLELCERRLHADKRRQAILREAATELRTGRHAGIVMAKIRAAGAPQP